MRDGLIVGPQGPTCLSIKPVWRIPLAPKGTGPTSEEHGLEDGGGRCESDSVSFTLSSPLPHSSIGSTLSGLQQQGEKVGFREGTFALLWKSDTSLLKASFFGNVLFCGHPAPCPPP